LRRDLGGLALAVVENLQRGLELRVEIVPVLDHLPY
jgi:hypothetical protein